MCTGKHLREKQALVRNSQDSNLHQFDMWRDLTRLMEAKMRAAHEHTDDDDAPPPGHAPQEDRMVL